MLNYDSQCLANRHKNPKKKKKTPSVHFGITSSHRVQNYVKFNNGRKVLKKLKHSFRHSKIQYIPVDNSINTINKLTSDSILIR